MVAEAPQFEYRHRWPDMAERGYWNCEDELEARDQALEFHLRNFNNCVSDFEYPYRWAQILQQDLDTQIAMLEARDVALELAIRDSGGCLFEYLYRWAQLLEGVAQGEAWAIQLVEENDRQLESKFKNCNCATFAPLFIQISGGPISPSATSEYTFTAACNLISFSSVGFTGSGPFNATHDLYKNGVLFFTRTGAPGTDSISESFADGDILTVNVTINTGTVTNHTASLELDGTEEVFLSWA